MTNEATITKETAEKLQAIRLQIVELKNNAKDLGCNVDDKIEDALQAIMAKEDEYWSTQSSCWEMFNDEITLSK